MSPPLSLKSIDWPDIDQKLWKEATSIPDFLSGSRPARKWSLSRRRIAEQSYGQWLSFLLRQGDLNATLSPGDRVTQEKIEIFIGELQNRIAPWSTVIMLQAFQRMLAVMEPERDWYWLRLIISNLKRLAEPSRDRRGHMVDPRDLYRLGFDLMDQAMQKHSEGRFHAATIGRDGLMISLLACCPVRISNLKTIRMGEHLWFDHDRYCLSFDETETKNARAYDGELPVAMTPYVDTYLGTYRPILLGRGNHSVHEALWITREGCVMGEAAIRHQIKERTRTAFGRHIWPHLFRAISATGFVDYAPDEVGLVPDLLGHSSVTTAHKHYILSDGAKAHKLVQSNLIQQRRAALARLKG